MDEDSALRKKFESVAHTAESDNLDANEWLRLATSENPDDTRRAVSAVLVGPSARSLLSEVSVLQELTEMVRNLRRPTGAAFALASVRYAPSVPALIQLLTDPGQTRRLAAATALGQQGDAKAVGPLLRILNNEVEDDEVRLASLTSLVRLGLGSPHKRGLFLHEVETPYQADSAQPTSDE